jgi:hypothetical protein
MRKGKSLSPLTIATTFDSTFSEQQRHAIRSFQLAIEEFCGSTPTWLDPAETLADPRWWFMREKAEALVVAFRGQWLVDV